ncbi:MAG: hypothetical protein JSU00_11875 [Acidobacteria bacterium]|nr:hypothetical protein [Acidobacteriota bacterium]
MNVQHRLRLPALLSALLVTIVQSACVGGRPSPSAGSAQLEQQIHNQSNGLIKLVSFDKTNGVDQEMNGVKVYEMDWTAEIEFLGNCMWGAGPFGGDSFTAVPGWPGGGLDAFNPRFFGKQRARKGQRQKIEGKFMFQKAEQGWRLVR